MSLKTIRLGETPNEPNSLEVESQIMSASSLLWHLERNLLGLRVVAKNTWVLTDDFEAYFVYKNRLFVMETPFVNVWVSLLGKPINELLFSEVEAQIQNYNLKSSALSPIAWLRYTLLPSNPPDSLLKQYGAL